MAEPHPSLLVVPERVAQNAEAVTRIRTMSSLISGVAAGILGITGWVGLLFFLIHAVVVSQIIISVSNRGNCMAHFVNGKSDLFAFGGLATGLLTFVLAWTLAYDAIYIF